MLNNERRDDIIEEILDTLQIHTKLLKQIIKEVVEIEQEHSYVISGNIFQLGDTNMLPITPGNSPQFAVTPQPTGVATLAAQTEWTSADPINTPVTMNASDPTGLTATVNIASTATEPVTVNLTWKYTNADGTVVTVNGVFTGATDVTGGTMAQTV
jgi:hypothetical protein